MDKRRNFIKKSTITAGGLIILPSMVSCSNNSKNTEKNMTHSIEEQEKELFFKISLAEWSFHRALRAGEFTNLEFPAKTKELGIHAVEYVSPFFNDKETDQGYLNDLKQRTGDLDVENVLIMVDGEGYLGDLDEKKRIEAVENHYKWIEAAKFLGCHSIRVNAYGSGTAEEVKSAAIDGLGRLSEEGRKNGINVIVENHGGYSSIGTWLADVMKQVNNPYCGTLPDFGNFKIGENEFYDHYKGIEEMMPFAKGVSAKSHNFDGPEATVCTGSGNTNTKSIDFMKMMKIVKDAGYTGYVGIEYEGSKTPEAEQITLTKKVLENVGKALS